MMEAVAVSVVLAHANVVHPATAHAVRVRMGLVLVNVAPMGNMEK
jgi:hypothetical protein